MSYKSKKSFLLISIGMAVFLAAGACFAFSGHAVQFYSGLNKILKNEEVKADEGTRIERKVFGYSAQGRAVEGYEIGFGENTILMLAAMHGSERASSDLLSRLAMEIALKPGLVSKANKLIIIPVANPDGYYERGDKLNGNGVNLDLNFATSDWKRYGPEGTYAGPEPFSEPESQLIKKIVEDYQPEMMISFHSYGDLVSPEAGESSIKLAKWYMSKTGYKYYDVWDYPGTATKWFTETTGKPAITVEISKDLLVNWEKNKRVLSDLVSARDLLF